ncbi:MAG: SPOR domain-containing protein [Bacteroidota bacterium]
MIRVVFTTLLFTFALSVAKAQVVVNEPATISDMLDRYVQLNKRSSKVTGWRILIHATRNRVEMENVLRKFQFNYPNINATWVHDRPYYKVRAGAFESKLEAQRLLHVIRRDYPDASTIRDTNMNMGELIF